MPVFITISILIIMISDLYTWAMSHTYAHKVQENMTDTHEGQQGLMDIKYTYHLPPGNY